MLTTGPPGRSTSPDFSLFFFGCPGHRLSLVLAGRDHTVVVVHGVLTAVLLLIQSTGSIALAQ